MAPGASENEVKKAYRRAVLEYHPDVNRAVGAAAHFMTIQQAYELLSGRGRGGPDGDATRSHGGGSAAESSWHDWYWAFVQRRRWGGYKKASASAAAAASASAPHGSGERHGTDADSSSSGMPPPPPPPHRQPQHQATLRSQLAGLRHRAAVRAHRPPRHGHMGMDVGASTAEPGARVVGVQDAATAAAASAQPTTHAGYGGMEYDSAMSDGCNVASSGVTDWAAAEAVRAADPGRRRFSCTDGHRRQVAAQVARLHRHAAANSEAGSSGSSSTW